ncbi:hypothetical protein ACS0TY_000752 [Phlomoides rotata]
METDFDPSADAEAESKAKELESMKRRLQEIEEEAGALREMQAKVVKEMDATQVVEENKEESSVYFLGED